jgi:NitT/TauT family transport system ATP-binding protein
VPDQRIRPTVNGPYVEAGSGSSTNDNLPRVTSGGGTGLTLEGVDIAYLGPDGHRTVAVTGVSFDIRAGSFSSIVGPSGCGKSSLLNVLAGLLYPTAGRVTFAGRPIAGPSRDRAMVFQTAALLPWRSLIDNVVFGAELQGRGSKKELRERATELIDLVGLRGNETLYPHQLSGGMQQRVNLARALMLDPRLLLLDEPFGALDSYTRDLMQEELERITSRIDSTVLLVTHQISEAVYLSDEVLVMGGTMPGRLLHNYRIAAPRPRGYGWRDDPAARELEKEIASLLRPKKSSSQLLDEEPMA